jgi:hypothetical protein
MNKCDNCGNMIDGQAYSFYYGWLTEQNKSSVNFGIGKATSTKSTFRIGGEGQALLCNRCVNRLNFTFSYFLNILAFFVLGVTVILLGTVEENLRFCFAVGAVPIFIGVILLLPKKATAARGERAAVRWARKGNLHGAKTIYWTTKEYKELK